MLNPVQLEKALKGEHVILESGETAIVIADIRKHKPDADYPIIGYVLDDDGDFFIDKAISWTDRGRFFKHEFNSRDIVCLKSDKKYNISINNLANNISKNKDYYFVDLLKKEVIKITIDESEDYSDAFLFLDENSAMNFLEQLMKIK